MYYNMYFIYKYIINVYIETFSKRFKLHLIFIYLEYKLLKWDQISGNSTSTNSSLLKLESLE